MEPLYNNHRLAATGLALVMASTLTMFAMIVPI